MTAVNKARNNAGRMILDAWRTSIHWKPSVANDEAEAIHLLSFCSRTDSHAIHYGSIIAISQIWTSITAGFTDGSFHKTKRKRMHPQQAPDLTIGMPTLSPAGKSSARQPRNVQAHFCPTYTGCPAILGSVRRERVDHYWWHIHLLTSIRLSALVPNSDVYAQSAN